MSVEPAEEQPDSVSPDGIAQSPRLIQFRFSSVIDPSFMVPTECYEKRAVLLPPDTTIPIKIRIRSTVGYDLIANFSAYVNNPLNHGVPGVTFWFDEPSITLEPLGMREVTLFVQASKDVEDTTTEIGWGVSTRGVERSELHSGNSDWLYLMVGKNPNEPKLFVFYPSLVANGSVLYQPEDGEVEDLFLEMRRGEKLIVTIPVSVRSDATYPINFTLRRDAVYLFPDESVRTWISPSSILTRAGDRFELTLVIEVDEDFVSFADLPESQYPKDHLGYGKDLYMYIDLWPDAIANGFCMYMNLPWGIWPGEGIFFEMDQQEERRTKYPVDALPPDEMIPSEIRCDWFVVCGEYSIRKEDANFELGDRIELGQGGVASVRFESEERMVRCVDSNANWYAEHINWPEPDSTFAIDRVTIEACGLLFKCTSEGLVTTMPEGFDIGGPINIFFLRCDSFQENSEDADVSIACVVAEECTGGRWVLCRKPVNSDFRMEGPCPKEGEE